MYVYVLYARCDGCLPSSISLRIVKVFSDIAREVSLGRSEALRREDLSH